MDNKKPIIMEMNKFVATMVANNSQIERTGIPMTDEEFTGLYKALPNNIRIEVSQDMFDGTKTAPIKNTSEILGNGKSRTTRSRRGVNGDDYDEVSVMLNLDTPGKVRAFRKSTMFRCDGKAVTEDEFNVPEEKHNGRPVYRNILDREGIYGVYAETRIVTVPNVSTAKTAKPKVHKKRYDEAQEGDRAVALESVVPIECCSLFQPSHAGVTSFVSKKQRKEMDNFLEFMEYTEKADIPKTLVYLAGLFDLINDKEVDEVLATLEAGYLLENSQASYIKTVSSLLTDMTDNKTPITVNTTIYGEIDIASGIIKAIENNRSLKAIYENGLSAIKTDKYLRVLLEDSPTKALASILSSYIPMTMPDLVDMGPEANLELIFNLMQLAGGHVGNEQVTLTVRECDVVTFGSAQA